MTDDAEGYNPFTIAVARLIAKKDGVDFDTARNFGEDNDDPLNYTVPKSQYLQDAGYIVEGFYAMRNEGLDINEVVAAWNNTLPLVEEWEKEIANEQVESK